MENKDKKRNYKIGVFIFIALILIALTYSELISFARYLKSDRIENINLTITPPPKKLITGNEFNMKIKNIASSEEANNIIEKIVFDYWNNGYTEDSVELYSNDDWDSGIAIDKDLKGAIRMFKSEDGKNIYILSESAIYANTDSADMFYNLNSVVEFKFNNLNVSNVENMYRMFAKCSNLEILDLSSFDTINVTNMRQIFNQNENLETIYVSEKWNTHKVNHTDIVKEDEPFLGCESIVGENGTTYNQANINISYACVDEGEEKPGYFTYKEEGTVLNNLRNDKEENKIENESTNEIIANENVLKIENEQEEILNEPQEQDYINENIVEEQEENVFNNEIKANEI